MDKLVKEIITTTTEKYGDNGNIKEKVVETREKVYQTNFTEKQIKEAEVIKTSTPATKKEVESKSQTQLIEDAAKAIDNGEKKEEKPGEIPNLFSTPQYNVASRASSEPLVPKFPWEK